MSRPDPLSRLTAGLGELAGLMRRRGEARPARITLYDRRGQGRALDPEAEPGRSILELAGRLLELGEGSAEPPSQPPGA